ncbi:unnamed protein product [Mytilus coruscus]|uniref:Uncharacterized protein n=1 Tax=Mytilus coruscus TaxID=42192 RepID=A0A6J8DLB4_MYTCO|nr:unnamed protein product [Mytilus coruscus]
MVEERSVLLCLLGLLSTSYGFDVSKTNCELKPVDESFAKYMDNPGITLNEFYFKMRNYSQDPLYHNTGENYKLWRWHRTRTQHGRTLLMLSFHYDVLSMTILTIGVEPSEVLLQDNPFGCFGNITVEERGNLLRELILNDFYVTKKTSSQIEYESHTMRVVYACNSVVKNYHGYGKFINRCCNLEPNGQLLCTDQVEDAWITLLYVCITLVKVMVFLFGPLMIPSHMYDVSYMASQYVVKLQKELKMKLFVTESAQTSVRYKTRLTIQDISEWKKFQEVIGEFPMDKVIPIQIPELKIKVKGKRVIPENEPPTGLLRTLYDNLVRCKVKALDPFNECCDRSVYAKFEPQFKHKCTWHMCAQTFIRVLMVFLIPIPFYMRIFLYYQFEEGELLSRRNFSKSQGLAEYYDFYRTNIIQHLSPTHGIFIAAYVFYFLTFVSIALPSKSVSEKVKSIARCSFQDMLNVERTSVLQVLLRIGLWPFKNWGLLALLTAPVYTCVMAPACSLIFAVYCLPTIYLTYRLFYHARNKIDYKEQNVDDESPMITRKPSVVKIKKIKKNITKIDKTVHKRLMSISENEEHIFPCTWGSGTIYNIRRCIVQILVGVFCVSCLYSFILLAVEATGILVEIMAFTMMGIIVNAGSTLRYVSMALLVLVYMHDCYNNVYESYLTFNKAVIDDIMDRVEDLKTVASLPSSMQESIGFTVKPVEAVDRIPTAFVFDKSEPRWRIGHLLLFLDSFDTPRIPLRLFKKLCEVRVHGAPGPVYINLLRATGKFFIIVVFLFFVMIVVMAFGNVHQISSTNQTLATLAGGFVPMLLKNILPRKSVKLNLKTLSFKGQIDEVICEFKQNWPVCDLVIEKDEPKIDDEDETKENSDIGDEKIGSPELKRKKSCESILDGKPEDKEKEKEKEKPKENILEKYMKENAERKNKDKDKKDGNGTEGSERNSIVDENFVDLFVDLSVAETSVPWQMHGSTESVASASMLPEADFVTMESSFIDTMPQITVVNCDRI